MSIKFLCKSNREQLCQVIENTNFKKLAGRTVSLTRVIKSRPPYRVASVLPLNEAILS